MQVLLLSAICAPRWLYAMVENCPVLKSLLPQTLTSVDIHKVMRAFGLTCKAWQEVMQLQVSSSSRPNTNGNEEYGFPLVRETETQQPNNALQTFEVLNVDLLPGSALSGQFSAFDNPTGTRTEALDRISSICSLRPLYAFV